jgi:hypothetical protein
MCIREFLILCFLLPAITSCPGTTTAAVIINAVIAIKDTNAIPFVLFIIHYLVIIYVRLI